MLVISGTAVFLIQQAKSMNRLKTKVELLDLQSTITKIMSDANSCDCMFDMSTSANPYKNGPASNLIAVTSGNPDIEFEEFRVLGRDLVTGNCDYSSGFTIAEKGEPMNGIPTKAIVESINLTKLRRTATLDSDEDGTADAFEYKGDFEIKFVRDEGEKSLDPLISQVSFFTFPNGVAKSCDPSAEIAELFKKRLEKFTLEREAIDEAFNDALVVTRNEIPGERAKITPEVTREVARATASAGTEKMVVVTGGTQHEAWAGNKPGTGPYTPNDDFKEIMDDFKRRWGFPL